MTAEFKHRVLLVALFVSLASHAIVFAMATAQRAGVIPGC